ncbi:MAG TPA: hypothetical protein VHL50_03205, partial [Pyrinomonadaceae bacterium]|nr:hypothetical protein [Pyrinomonadaceae bacterium]
MNYFRIASVLLAVAFLSLAVAAQADLSGFNGTWALDRTKTDVNHDFPEKLQDFRMLVGSDQERLMVKSQVVGTVELRTKERGNALAGGLSTQGSRTTVPSQNGVMATTGATASASPLQASYGGTL